MGKCKFINKYFRKHDANIDRYIVSLISPIYHVRYDRYIKIAFTNKSNLLTSKPYFPTSILLCNAMDLHIHYRPVYII